MRSEHKPKTESETCSSSMQKCTSQAADSSIAAARSIHSQAAQRLYNPVHGQNNYPPPETGESV